ncbi:hypothetical protein I4U23_022700 [Adineta vaga]|nr:hypothetical protein I4U23_022700 [Adineta vaga]
MFNWSKLIPNFENQIDVKHWNRSWDCASACCSMQISLDESKKSQNEATQSISNVFINSFDQLQEQNKQK